LMWSRQDFEMLERKYPVISANVCGELSRRLHDFEHRFAGYVNEKAKRRLAAGLLNLLKSPALSSTGANTVTLRRDELAQFSGVSVFTVSRTLSEWENSGLVNLDTHAITVPNIDRFAYKTGLAGGGDELLAKAASAALP